jgi:anti-anti-sigma factor
MLDIQRSVVPETKSVVLTIGGAADFHNVDPLVNACNAVAAGKHAEVTVDLGGLTFICSLAIGALVSLQRSVRTSGGVMRLTKVQPAIYQCLHHARLNEVFTIIGPS